MDRNPPITTQGHDLLNSVKQRTCFLRGPRYDWRQRNMHFEDASSTTDSSNVIEKRNILLFSG